MLLGVPSSDGRYEFPPLPPHKYKITVRPIGSNKPDDSEVDLTSGRCRDITLDRSPHAKIGRSTGSSPLSLVEHLRAACHQPAAWVCSTLIVLPPFPSRR